MNRVIAIDGPSGAGKSTVARAIGRALGFLHVDSGALYRIVTWQALRYGVDCGDETAVSALVERLKVTWRVCDGGVVCASDGEEPGEAIRQPEINAHVSPVSKVPAVRARVTAWLREMRQLGHLVVEGRDIGSVVFPDTPARFYLDADPEERARRRHLEEIGKGISQSRDAVLASLLKRDRIDSTRVNAPLRVADGACVIDSTAIPVEEVLRIMRDRLPPEWLPSLTPQP
ncbi:MAG: (d)CMP kinase [Kiritimatiellae bacterium]|nr:(d)CMP kinase [Kiritimatiellia bacterium]